MIASSSQFHYNKQICDTEAEKMEEWSGTSTTELETAVTDVGEGCGWYSSRPLAQRGWGDVFLFNFNFSFSLGGEVTRIEGGYGRTQK